MPAPTAKPRRTPSPAAQGPFVVAVCTNWGANSLSNVLWPSGKCLPVCPPKPPLVKITASALITSFVSFSVSGSFLTISTPATALFSMTKFVTRAFVTTCASASSKEVKRFLRVSTNFQPTGTGRPFWAGQRWVRPWEWPPQRETTDKSKEGTPSTSLSLINQSSAGLLSSTSFVTRSSRLIPAPELSVSWMNASRVSLFNGSTALMPEVAFIELPPMFFSLSIRMTLVLPWLWASTAAVRPAKPPPTTTTVFCWVWDMFAGDEMNLLYR